ncbi:50S ribosomal protein L11 methyltransferase [bacterium]|nr:50S ribosomal protein L11 methyltransferase [bacterium]
MKKPDSIKKENKKSYQKPALKEYGSIKDHTKAITGATGMDGGVAPSNRTMTCVSLPPFIQEHLWLLEDQYTQEKFRAAIFAKVKPGDVVLDLGTGTGLHAIFAAQAGAQRVYAVDSEAIVQMAKVTAEKNHCLEKITFIQTSSETLELPEKVDVIITNIGFFNTLKYLPQVVSRHLKPGGQLIPESVNLEFALLEDANFYDTNIKSWEQNKFATDFSAFKNLALSRPFYGGWQPEQLLSKSQALGQIELNENAQFNLEANTVIEIPQAGTIHGIVGWYTFHLSEGISFSTKPPLQLSPLIWNQWFLPATTPLSVKPGERIQVSLRMSTSQNFSEPIWQWAIATEKTKSNFDTMVFAQPN